MGLKRSFRQNLQEVLAGIRIFFTSYLFPNPIMALSKQNLYPSGLQFTSGSFRALNHAARLLILEQLRSEGPLCVQVIAEKHPISPEALSGHLKILRDAGLVDCTEKFPFTFYRINTENLEKAISMFETFFLPFQQTRAMGSSA